MSISSVNDGHKLSKQVLHFQPLATKDPEVFRYLRITPGTVSSQQDGVALILLETSVTYGLASQSKLFSRWNPRSADLISLRREYVGPALIINNNHPPISNRVSAAVVLLPTVARCRASNICRLLLIRL